MKKKPTKKITKSTNKKLSLTLFVAAFLLLGAVIVYSSFAATSSDGTLSSSATKNTSPCSASGLKFCDDFNGATGSKPDGTKWNILTGASGWGVECFTNSPSNISLDGNGNLALTVLKQAGCSTRNYTSGGVDTKGKYTFQYGKIEIRAKVACGGGVWPALWTSTGTGPSWPNSGEIDLLEVMDGDQFDAQQTIHGPNGTSNGWQINKTNSANTKWCNDYHVYGAEWRLKSIKFTIDGVVKHTITPSNMQSGWIWPFDSYNQRILLDLQIGNQGGAINNADLPSTMLIDYIRIFS